MTAPSDGRDGRSAKPAPYWEPEECRFQPRTKEPIVGRGMLNLRLMIPVGVLHVLLVKFGTAANLLCCLRLSCFRA